MNSPEDLIPYIKDENRKPKKNLKIYSLIYNKETVGTFVFIATTSNSATLSKTGFLLIVTHVSTGVACGITLAKKSLYQLIMQKVNKDKRFHEVAAQIIKAFDSLYKNVYKTR